MSGTRRRALLVGLRTYSLCLVHANRRGFLTSLATALSATVYDEDRRTRTASLVRSIRDVVLAVIGIRAAVVAWCVVAWCIAPPVIAIAVGAIGGGSSRSTQDAKTDCGPRSVVVAATIMASVVDLGHS